MLSVTLDTEEYVRIPNPDRQRPFSTPRDISAVIHERRARRIQSTPGDHYTDRNEHTDR